jgi:DNA-directed RNA polymerase alpha subunit
MSYRYDPPEVYDEDELKTYGKKIAADVRSGVEEEKPDFEALRSLSLKAKQELALTMLGVPIRTLNVLEIKGIFTIGQLVKISHHVILAIPNCGNKSVLDCYDALAGLQLVDLWDVLPDDLLRLRRGVK